ncbi:MAG TPA: MFS transporter [Gemmatimonadaceae bacterium]|nr:MFS transporter [Gemmatimonadaceae bacterium]
MSSSSIGRYRWKICALLFFATTINYIDRQVLGILAPTLQSEFGWTQTQYGGIVSWFTLAYAIGYAGVGRLLDRVGTRLGFAFAVIVWSLAAIGHALANSARGFAVARFALGFGESGNFPGSIKAVTEWFPARERALATGIFNAGSNVGAMLTPLIVPFIALRWGWRMAFIITGALGFIWLIAWLLMYQLPEQHARVTPGELAHIRSDALESSEPIPWKAVFRHRQTWAFAAGKLITDPVWWFYLFWLPKFLDERYGVRLAAVALPLITIYLMADFGSVAGGWFSSFLIKRGWSVNRARKTALLIAAVAIVPTMFAPAAPNLAIAVAFVALAAAAHQWWSANLFTIPGDMFPRRAIGTVVGIGGFAGAMSGFFFQRIVGAVLDANGNDYTPIFIFAGLAYVTALAVIHLLVPRMTPAKFDDSSRL